MEKPPPLVFIEPQLILEGDGPSHYTKRGAWTSEYEVLHPRWMMYPILQHSIDVDFGALYGSEFASLSKREPESVLLAEGSEIEVRGGERITAVC